MRFLLIVPLLQGMYRQLLQQSQPRAGRSCRRGVSSGAGARRRREENGGLGRGGGGGGGGGGRRAADRFGFINAVMAHARDGGDPLDIEEACGSDTGGFAQDCYAGTPDFSPTQQQQGRGEDGGGVAAAAGCPDWSPCDPMSSGGSAQSSNG